jgi:transcriptional regulator with XRE-family HTH domain
MEILNRIASTLKTIRRDRGWSLDKAAQETGVSKAMLGQIERAESSPTISTLWKIASGFKVPFSLFIADDQPVHGTGQTRTLHPRDDKIKVFPIFPFDEKLRCEMFLIELLPGCEHISPPHQPNVIEHVLVAEGAMEVFSNSSWKLLAKGQGLRFDACQSHGYRNFSGQSSTIYDIIHYPSD